MTDGDLVELGAWPRLTAQILRARLESAGISVLTAWPDAGAAPDAVLHVHADDADFARAVVNELDAADEVPDTSPFAYLVRIEEHLAAAGELVHELRTRLEHLEGEEGDAAGAR